MFSASYQIISPASVYQFMKHEAEQSSILKKENPQVRTEFNQNNRNLHLKGTQNSRRMTKKETENSEAIPMSPSEPNV